jgi:hypothetical protein
MRNTLLLAFGLLPCVAFSQATILSDDFESYTSGELLAANSTLWTTWSGGVDAEDAYVSSDQSNSGSNSVHVVGNNGPTDLILPFPSDYTSGVYEFSLKMYIVSGNGGYFNIQRSSVPGDFWMFEIFFDNSGGGYINAGGTNAATLTYTPETWMSINVLVDLNKDSAELFINSHSIYSWQWSLGATGLGNIVQMGGVDIFAYGANGNGDFYVDNVLLEEKTTTGIIVDDFERYVGGELLAANSDLWTTWSGGLDLEDAYVSLAHASSGFNSVNVTGNNGPTDLYLPFPSDYTTGVYEFSVKMDVSSDNGAYWNIQESATPGIGWMFEIWCDNAGGGYINAGGSNAATFTYTPNSWMDVKVKADLTNDIGECYINSNLIHTWQWSTGYLGTGTNAPQIGGVDFYAAGANGTDANYYIDDVLLATAFPTGITAEGSGADVLVAPNPSNGHFSVAADNLPVGDYQIQLTDVLGNLISSETLKVSGSVKKDFSVHLASGIYYVRFTNGNNVSTRKIVIN